MVFGGYKGFQGPTKPFQRVSGITRGISEISGVHQGGLREALEHVLAAFQEVSGFPRAIQ